MTPRCSTFGRLLHRWHRAVDERAVTVADLAGILRIDDARLAHALRRAHRRVFDGFQVRRAGFCDGRRRWRVVKVTP